MLAKHMIDDAVVQLGKLKDQADKAIGQITAEQMFATIDAEANSIALIMKHVAGNMRSRWTNFLTSDGEKPDRNRDSEFEPEGRDTRETILAAWEHAWTLTLDTVSSLAPEDLEKTVRIRGQAHTVVEAINRQLSHYAGHVGQIVLLAKHYAGDRWQTLSMPKRKAAQF
jgi:hypothetical protein